MTIALGVCMLVAVLALWLAPQPQGQFERKVDYQEVAASAQQAADFQLAAPSVPRGWVANEAQYKPLGSPKTKTWYVSWIGPGQQWVSLYQSQGNQTWVKGQLVDASAVGQKTFAGVTFDTYRTPKGTEYFVADIRDTVVILAATAQEQSIEHIATQIVQGS